MRKAVPFQNPAPIQQELLRALRYHRPLSLLAVSAELASNPSLLSSTTRLSDVLRRHLRGTDALAEDSGTQTFLLLPETSLEGALILGNRLVRDIMESSGPFESLTIGISSIDDGVYRADDLISTAILANRAGKVANRAIFPLGVFLDRSLSLSFASALAIALPGEDIIHLSSFLERNRHEPEGLRSSAATLIVKIAGKMKVGEEIQDVLRFWTLLHDLPRHTSPDPATDEKMPHLSRRKKALHSLILSFAPKAKGEGLPVDKKAQALLSIFQAVLDEISSFPNPTEEILVELITRITARFESQGTEKQILSAVRKAEPSEWFPYPT